MRKIWMTLCRPLLEYGTELWEGEISEKLAAKLEAIQSSFSRAALGLRGQPAQVGLRAEMALPALRSRRQTLKLLFWSRLCCR